jgi:hypothetical protein
VFAGHGLAISPILSGSLAAPSGVRFTDPVPAMADLAPGRGLAAPPPPSQGPPTLLV